MARTRKDNTSSLEEILYEFKSSIKGGNVYLSELSNSLKQSRRSLHTLSTAKYALSLGITAADKESLGNMYRDVDIIFDEEITLEQLDQMIKDLKKHMAELESRMKVWKSIDGALSNLKGDGDRDDGPFGHGGGGGRGLAV